MPKYKIEFDRELCIGALACTAVAENFWPTSEDGKVDLTGATYNEETKKWELIIEEKDFEINKDAADVCPVDAIVITKIEDEIMASTLADPYETLLNTYIKPFLTHAAASDYISTAGIRVDNGGISTYQPDNGNAANSDAIVNLTKIVDNRANAYGLELTKYLKDNQSLFTEYKASTVSGVYFGWQLNSNNGCD